MTRTFSDGHPKVLPACNFLSQYYFYNIFLVLQVFSSNSYEKRKWRWIFAFDRCVELSRVDKSLPRTYLLESCTKVMDKKWDTKTIPSLNSE